MDFPRTLLRVWPTGLKWLQGILRLGSQAQSNNGDISSFRLIVLSEETLGTHTYIKNVSVRDLWGELLFYVTNSSKQQQKAFA